MLCCYAIGLAIVERHCFVLLDFHWGSRRWPSSTATTDLIHSSPPSRLGQSRPVGLFLGLCWIFTGVSEMVLSTDGVLLGLFLVLSEMVFLLWRCLCWHGAGLLWCVLYCV